VLSIAEQVIVTLFPEAGSRLARRLRWLAPLSGGALVGIVMRLIYSGHGRDAYSAMMSSFVLLVPLLVGAVAVFIAEHYERRSPSRHFWIGANANALFVLGTFLVMIEGLACTILAIPLFWVLGGLGGVAMGVVCRWTNWGKRTVYCMTALPLLLGGLEQYLPLPQEFSSTERTLVVAVPPEAIWKQLLTAADIRGEEMGGAWMYRIGVPLPTAAITEMTDGTAVRHITMGKGIHFDQVAAAWEPNRRVRWLYRFAPDSFPPQALDDHIRIGGSYFDLVDTEYSLNRVAAGTEFRVRMTYRVSTGFNWYARPLAALFVGNFEEAALAFYARRASTFTD
jgi:hypothetical protein